MKITTVYCQRNNMRQMKIIRIDDTTCGHWRYTVSSSDTLWLSQPALKFSDFLMLKEKSSKLLLNAEVFWDFGDIKKTNKQEFPVLAMVVMLAKDLSSCWVQEHVGKKMILTCLKASISYQASKDWRDKVTLEELMAKTFPKLIKEDKPQTQEAL